VRKHKSFQTSLAEYLRETRRAKCIDKAINLENNGQNKSVELKSLDLSAPEVQRIAHLLNLDKINKQKSITSISLSHNPNLGDYGAEGLANSFPAWIEEIGLVDCGIGDQGGNALLNWAKTAPKLKMICVEKNNFSANIKAAFKNLGSNNSKLVVEV